MLRCVLLVVTLPAPLPTSFIYTKNHRLCITQCSIGNILLDTAEKALVRKKRSDYDRI